MIPIAVLDACVLYSAPLRDLLMRLASGGLFQARWSERILDEAFQALVAQRPDLDPARLQRTRLLMCEALPNAMVRGYEKLAAELELPDPKDNHVLAAAIRAGAQWIVTRNVKDFPSRVLGSYGVEVRTPDQLVVELLRRTSDMVVGIVRRQAMLLRNPPQSFEDLLETLAHQGLTQAVSELRALSVSQESGSGES